MFSFDNFGMFYRLLEIGKGDIDLVNGITKSPSSSMGSGNVRSPHCSNCGHPGSKSAHLKIACEYCVTNGSRNCMKKSSSFKCTCSSCAEVRFISDCLINLVCPRFFFFVFKHFNIDLSLKSIVIIGK